jgi:hypothetical protein
MVHVGVDLHKRSSQLAVLMPDGEVTQQRLENDPTQLERLSGASPEASGACHFAGICTRATRGGFRHSARERREGHVQRLGHLA